MPVNCRIVSAVVKVLVAFVFYIVRIGKLIMTRLSPRCRHERILHGQVNQICNVIHA